MRRIGDRQVVLGIDRLDYTKGLPLKLEAWRRLLTGSPRWRRRAILIQLAIPSRENIASYHQQKDEVERLVINPGNEIPIRLSAVADRDHS